MTEISALDAKKEAQKIAFAPIFFQVAVALKELGIIKLISGSRQGISISKICETLNLSDYGVRVLLEAAECADMIKYLDRDTVAITKVGVFLNSDMMTEVNMNFTQDVCYDGAKFLTQSVKEGKPAGLKTLGDWPRVYEGLAHLPQQIKKSWFEFDHYYSDNAFPAALPLIFKHKPAYLFDIGGNTGKWSFKCCEYDQDVKVKILDLPGQLNVARENAEKEGLTSRIDFHQINLLDKTQLIPKGADAVWMSQFLDCFSEDEIVTILENVRQASDENTNIYILETFIDNQEYEAAKYCLTATSLYFTFIANGASKMYSMEAMNRLVEKSGLKVVETFELIGDSYHTLLRCQIA